MVPQIDPRVQGGHRVGLPTVAGDLTQEGGVERRRLIVTDIAHAGRVEDRSDLRRRPRLVLAVDALEVATPVLVPTDRARLAYVGATSRDDALALLAYAHALAIFILVLDKAGLAQAVGDLHLTHQKGGRVLGAANALGLRARPQLVLVVAHRARHRPAVLTKVAEGGGVAVVLEASAHLVADCARLAGCSRGGALQAVLPDLAERAVDGVALGHVLAGRALLALLQPGHVGVRAGGADRGVGRTQRRKLAEWGVDALSCVEVTVVAGVARLLGGAERAVHAFDADRAVAAADLVLEEAHRAEVARKVANVRGVVAPRARDGLAGVERAVVPLGARLAVPCGDEVGVVSPGALGARDRYSRAFRAVGGVEARQRRGGSGWTVVAWRARRLALRPVLHLGTILLAEVARRALEGKVLVDAEVWREVDPRVWLLTIERVILLHVARLDYHGEHFCANQPKLIKLHLARRPNPVPERRRQDVAQRA